MRTDQKFWAFWAVIMVFNAIACLINLLAFDEPHEGILGATLTVVVVYLLQLAAGLGSRSKNGFNQRRI